ncbi:MAG: hypothetical protein M1821_009624 [Bathelium mastoideum]|nr:MAG: hypothetical protein M1821_009624 [Bathelium mastoideum]KAI9688850.1 MAG: hypothetical protein M1822_001207 [Bathelium mastoideum]
MSANAPTLINLPPPPSDPVTPSDMGPGTPNSATTSMSELSTVAIKDGHRGHLPHHHSGHAPPFSNTSHSSTLDAERADRISRLAGLERVAAPRPSPFNPNQASASTTFGSGSSAGGVGGPTAASMNAMTPTGPGYFDPANPTGKERSTVGSASATGSIGGRTTTWASGSDSGLGAPTDELGEEDVTTTTPPLLEDSASQPPLGDDDDRMDTASSTGGFSDDANASLVGFGEGARTPARHSGIGSPLHPQQQQQLGAGGPAGPKPGSAVPMHLFPGGVAGAPGVEGGRASANSSQTTASAAEAARDARMIDGVTYDEGGPFVDTAGGRTPPPTGLVGQHAGRTPERARSEAERILREGLEHGEDGAGGPMVGQEGGKAGLGRFYFEGKGGQ